MLYLYYCTLPLYYTNQELDYKHMELHDCADELPLGIFDAMPPKERGIIILSVQVQSEKQLSIVFSGATYPFRQKLRP
jgi:hypothetical protein